jgi:uncharacterized membrane protein
MPETRARWIRKTSAEATLERWGKLLGATCFDILFGASVWYLMVRLFVFIGVLSAHPISGYVGFGVIALILPAAWYENWRAHRVTRNTLVCDRCNLVKAADGRLGCDCGGQYHSLDEMKWVDADSTVRSLPQKPSGQST